jgi:hypothetical protein
LENWYARPRTTLPPERRESILTGACLRLQVPRSSEMCSSRLLVGTS